mgnify:CR=1 FL=1
MGFGCFTEHSVCEVPSWTTCQFAADTRKMSLRNSELCAMAFDTVAVVKWHVAQLGNKMGGLTRAALRKEEGGMDKKESMMSQFHGSWVASQKCRCLSGSHLFSLFWRWPEKMHVHPRSLDKCHRKLSFLLFNHWRHEGRHVVFFRYWSWATFKIYIWKRALNNRCLTNT